MDDACRIVTRGSLLRVTGYTSTGHVGCWGALGIYALGFVGLLGVSLLSVLLPEAFFVPVMIGAVVLLLIVVVPIEYVRRHGPIFRDAEVLLDEGGVRVSVGRSRRYLPLDRVALEVTEHSVQLKGRWRTVRIRLHDGSEEAAKALPPEISDRRAHRKEDEPALRRAAERLPEWCARVTRHVEEQRSATGYRTADRWHDERLLELLLDRSQELDTRAAAGHALLRLAPEQTDAVRRACSAATPPVVVAMLYAAARDAFREPFERIAPFLTWRDRRDAERMAKMQLR